MMILCVHGYMQITCKKCHQSKEPTFFYPSKNKSGLTTNCKSCINQRHYERRRERRIEQGLKIKFPTLANRELLLEGQKYCPGCRAIKNLTEFSTMKVKSGVASHCRVCVASNAKAYYVTPKGKRAKQQSYQKNRDVLVDRNLRRKFGISLVEYQEKLKKQNNSCAICKKTPQENGKMLAVDHNHVTNRNRSLLCSSCNICIGFIEKNKLDSNTIFQYLLDSNQ